VRATDTVCRHGGDEFLVLLPEVDEPENAARVAREIVAELAKPYTIDGYELVVDYSDGSENTEIYTNPRKLVRRTLTLQRKLIRDGWVPSGPGMYGLPARLSKAPRRIRLKSPARLWAYVHRQAMTLERQWMTRIRGRTNSIPSEG